MIKCLLYLHFRVQNTLAYIQSNTQVYFSRAAKTEMFKGTWTSILTLLLNSNTAPLIVSTERVRFFDSSFKFLFFWFLFLDFFLWGGSHFVPYCIKTQQVPGDFAIIHYWLCSSLLSFWIANGGKQRLQWANRSLSIT